jgi:hypothetical protein
MRHGQAAKERTDLFVRLGTHHEVPMLCEARNYVPLSLVFYCVPGIVATFCIFGQ